LVERTLSQANNNNKRTLAQSLAHVYTHTHTRKHTQTGWGTESTNAIGTAHLLVFESLTHDDDESDDTNVRFLLYFLYFIQLLSVSAKSGA